MAIATGVSYRDMVVETATDFRVRPTVYTDPQVFDAEMRQIFERTWVYVGHETEIPEPGDYRTGAIGRLPIILTRGRDRAIHVLLNVCRHRGSVVCREEHGNSSLFRCPYHNWIYANDGTLMAISERDGYPDDWGQQLSGLVRAPRVGTYRGMIFASMAETGPSLDEHLGLTKQYIDLWFDQSPTGHMSVLQPHASYFAANWKLQLENTTDGWHARYVHDSAFKTAQHFGRRGMGRGWQGCQRGFPYGHGMLVRPFRSELPPDVAAEHQQLLLERYGPERTEAMHVTQHVTLFPNIHLMDFKIRVLTPVAVDKTIVHEYSVQLEDVPERVNEAIAGRLNSEGSLVAGFVNADDVEIFGRVQSGMHAARWLEWVWFSRGMHREVVEPTGERVSHDTDEVSQRSIYREWARLMSDA